MEVYYGVDFHPHQQTICWLDDGTGELKTRTIFHKNREELAGFYREMPKGTVGIEATGKADWFEELMFENGHKLLVGNSGLIRKRAESRHKSDTRDAENILTLLMRQDFPALWRRSRESVAILEMIRLRSGLVRAADAGLQPAAGAGARFRAAEREDGDASVPGDPGGGAGRSAQGAAAGDPAADGRAAERNIREIERRLEEEGGTDPRVALLRTQAGVGILTALCLIHTLGEVARFSSSRQVVAFAGLCPLEKSSGARVSFGGISRAGSPLLRYMLGQAANAAARRDERLRAFYRRLARRKPGGWRKRPSPESFLSNSRSCCGEHHRTGV
ncbi:MAG: IS110 family transposase [Acidobacteria bacterium]|nr:IS110 family transposase [Acidobacteriota bacterium]